MRLDLLCSLAELLGGDSQNVHDAFVFAAHTDTRREDEQIVLQHIGCTGTNETVTVTVQ